MLGLLVVLLALHDNAVGQLDVSMVTELAADCDGQVAHTRHLNGAELAQPAEGIQTEVTEVSGEWYVLREEEYREVKLRRIQLTQTLGAMHCGNYDHMTQASKHCHTLTHIK